MQLFEPELALLVGLQVVSSKEGGEGGEGGGNFLTRFFAWTLSLCRPWSSLGYFGK